MHYSAFKIQETSTASRASCAKNSSCQMIYFQYKVEGTVTNVRSINLVLFMQDKNRPKGTFDHLIHLAAVENSVYNVVVVCPGK